MKAGPLIKGKSLPLLINQPTGLSLGATLDWLEGHRSVLDNLTHRAGVILLRDLPIKTPNDFQSICRAIRPQLRKYSGGDSPRTSLTEFVYTSTEYQSGLEVLLHNELSYAGWSPDRVFFGCLQPAATGGETHVADGREIYRRLDPKIRKDFENKGVTYIQHLRDRSVSGPQVSLGRRLLNRLGANKQKIISRLQRWGLSGQRTASRPMHSIRQS